MRIEKDMIREERGRTVVGGLDGSLLACIGSRVDIRERHENRDEVLCLFYFENENA